MPPFTCQIMLQSKAIYLNSFYLMLAINNISKNSEIKTSKQQRIAKAAIRILKEQLDFFLFFFKVYIEHALKRQEFFWKSVTSKMGWKELPEWSPVLGYLRERQTVV